MTIIDSRTLAPIGASIVVVGACIGFAKWIDDRFDAVEVQIVQMRMEQQTLGATLETAMREQWSRADQELWAERLKSANAQIVVPPVTK